MLTGCKTLIPKSEAEILKKGKSQVNSTLGTKVKGNFIIALYKINNTSWIFGFIQAMQAI